MMLARSIVVLALALPTAASAQTPPAWRPGLGDLMTMTVQPRHQKLALAGRNKNWAYAAYEWHELEEALEHIAKQVPKWRELDIGQLMAATVKQPLDDVEAAIKAADGPRFDTAFRQLTDADLVESVARPLLVMRAEAAQRTEQMGPAHQHDVHHRERPALVEPIALRHVPDARPPARRQHPPPSE